MRVINKICLALFVMVFLFTCDDVLEEDITNDSVVLISPTNNQTVLGNTVQFNWKALDGADEYRIQVLNNNQNTIIDSLVSSAQFNYSLNSGDYKWRVKGVNFAYETAYTFPSNFTVQPSNDLTNQLVVLSTPSNNTYSNQINTIFTWATIETASYYDFELIKNNSGGQQTIYQESNITNTSLTLNSVLFDEDAEYIWKVKAINSTTNTETEFSSFSYFLDSQSPNQPTLTSPNDLATVNNTTTVTFSWNIGADSGTIQSTRSSQIEIASDIGFSNIIESQNTSSTSFQYVFNTVNDYYWRVKVLDASGNESQYSIIRTITIE